MLNLINKKKTRAEKNGDKDRKALSKLLSNAVYSEIMENVKKKEWISDS